MVDTGLKDKVALITGINNPHGIGAAAAKALAAQGAHIAATYLRSPAEAGTTNTPGETFYRTQIAKTAGEVVETIRQSGGKIEAWECNLADPAVIPDVFGRAERLLGPVSVLINNAAHCDPDTFIPTSELGTNSKAVDGFPVGAITADKHDHHFAVNSRAVALMMAEYVRRHIERRASWGRIINVSTDGASGFNSEVSYGASKHALESYSRAAARELGKYGITVNIASLGPTQTGWINPDLERSLAAGTPLGRVGRPDDVADVIVFLASEQARWLTGQLIYIGGGWRMAL